jgi:hypothetical protein
MKESAQNVEKIIRQCCKKYSINPDPSENSTQISFFFTYIIHDYTMCWKSFYRDHSMIQATEVVREILTKIKQESK